MRNLNVGYEEAVPIASLVDFPENPNQGDDGVVGTAIADIGFYGALVVDVETRTILAGHTRKRALLAAGEETAPVMWVEVDDLDHARRLLLVDNRANRLGYDDPGALVPLLEALAATAAGLTGTGWEGDDLDALLYEQRMAAAALESVGSTYAVPTPAERQSAFEEAGIRSVVLPLSTALYEELLGHLATLRDAWGLGSNAEVVLRLAREAHAMA